MRSPNQPLQHLAYVPNFRAFTRSFCLKFPALLLSLGLLLGPLVAVRPVMAQDLETRKAEAETIKAEAEARKAAIEAQQAEFDAKFPKATSTPLAGTTTTNDAAFIEEIIQGNKAVRATATQIAEDMYRDGTLNRMQVLVVQNPASINLLTSYVAGLKRIELLQRAYDQLIKEETYALKQNPPYPVDTPTARQTGSARRSFANVLGAATSTVGSFVDFLSFFRTNVDIRGETFGVNEDVFVDALFDAITTRYGGRVRLYYPTDVPPNLGDPANSEILRQIQVLYEKKDLAEDKEQEIKEVVALKREQIEGLNQLIAEAKRAIDDANKPPADSDEVQASNGSRVRGRRADRGTFNRQSVRSAPAPAANGLEQKIAEYKKQIWILEQEISRLNRGALYLPGTNTQFTNLIKDLLAVDEKSGISLITGYIQTEGLKDAMSSDDSYWLTLEVVKAGGNRKVQSNLIWDVFRGGAKITHSGGAVVHFNVYDKKGRSVFSGIRSSYLPYRSPKKITGAY
ncbi:MAG: hypothetical protein ICV60_01400 [Pyrinomonadaceae bacterium]|nr:hypothetical protein [Pyrinomonadaceae bacterium]